MNVIETIKFGICYFITLMLLYGVFPTIIPIKLLDYIVLSAGFAGIMMYAYLTNQETYFSFAKYFLVLITYLIVSILYPIFAQIGGSLGYEIAPWLDFGKYVILITGLIWASGLFEEEQEIEKEEFIM